ncbi:p-type had superfamily atpase [Lasius niger]|uniref:P-type had superfamily atpase n=1 Tax=Lasius niger TaxID=67767 RepID=A0A0J7MNS4_LASNI|nr:p-type had superfamily atpase [Lasius niger]
MKKLLTMKAPDSEKATLYKQILQKYVKFPEVNVIHPSPQQQQQQQQQPDWNLPDIGRTLFNDATGPQKPVVSSIMLFLQNYKNIISWNAKNELVLKGVPLPYTDIQKNIKYLFKNVKTQPNGFSAFKKVLDELDFPEELIKNYNLKKKKSFVETPSPPILAPFTPTVSNVETPFSTSYASVVAKPKTSIYETPKPQTGKGSWIEL